MSGSYNAYLVMLSIGIAVLASYTTLDLTNRVSASATNPAKSWAWLVAGAISLGTGIWAMHFIGMLAFHLGIPVAYDLDLTGLSMLIAVAVSATALGVLRQQQVALSSRLAAGALMGSGIAAMHYTGMAAMRMWPRIDYDPLLFLTSVLIALAASFAALSIALRLRHDQSRFAVFAKFGSAIVMGVAIAGMHYTGMAAARFAPGSVCLAAVDGGLSNGPLAWIIGAITASILCMTLVLSTIDGHFAAKNARLAQSLRVARDEAEAALAENRTINERLRGAQSQLVAAGRRAGMAEIANNVLHNVGNVLNSLNVSASLVQGRLRESKLNGLSQALQLMDQHNHDLGSFFVQDEKGRRLPGYLKKLAQALRDDEVVMNVELAAMIRSIDHIKEIVRTQQSYSGSTQLLEAVNVAMLIEDALRMSMSDEARQKIAINSTVEVHEPVLLDKHAVLQILINLLGNARDALGDTSAPPEIRIHAVVHGGDPGSRSLRLSIADSGVGILEANLPQLFRHGFTTKPSGHGYGLHSSALAAKAMSGSLTAASSGPGTGATFTLEIPVRIDEQALAHAG